MDREIHGIIKTSALVRNLTSADVLYHIVYALRATTFFTKSITTGDG